MRIKLLCTIKTKHFRIPRGTILEESVQISTGLKGFVDPSQLVRFHEGNPLGAAFIPESILDSEDYEAIK